MSNLLKNKKIWILLGLVVLIPFIIPIIEILVNCLFYIGKYIGTWVRELIDIGIC